MDQDASVACSFNRNFGPDQPFEVTLTKASVFHNLISMLPLTSASKPMQSPSLILKPFFAGCIPIIENIHQPNRYNWRILSTCHTLAKDVFFVTLQI